MDKLINLLNEYEAKRHKTSVIPRIRRGEDRLSYLEMNWSYSELLCISKRYGFIEWLVENEKIDLDKIKLFSIFNESWYYNAYQSLLMALSIQDKPIDFLISILR